MTQEEKAKAYDEAKLRMSAAYNSNRCTIGFMNEIFPELKESEDERIRKSIICALKQYYIANTVFDGFSREDMIAWLEKQGEQKPNYNNKELKDVVIAELSKYNSNDLNVPWATDSTGIQYPLYFANLGAKWQGEQKSIESIPEFKEGDILYNKDSYASDSIFIFKGMSDKTNVYFCYARLYNKKDFTVYSKENWDKGVGIYGGEFYPANNKQKELLFLKMKEAGYEWNAEKKELKKIEEKSHEGIVDEINRKVFPNHYGSVSVLDIHNPAWSEEDEEMIRSIFLGIEAYSPSIIYGNGKEKVLNWLKSLKDRYAWKPSEKQILAIETAINVIGKGTLNGGQLTELLEQLKAL